MTSLHRRGPTIIPLDSGPKQVAAQRAKADAAAAQVQAAEAELETDRLNLSYTKIIAPDSGIVNQKTVQVGQYVSAGQTMMTLIPLTNIWVTETLRKHSWITCVWDSR